MLKKHHQFFESMLWLFDLAMVTLGFAIAYVIRFQVLTPKKGYVPLRDNVALWAMSMVIFSLVFRSSDLYRSHRLTNRADEIFKLFKATGLAMLLLVAATYFFARGAVLPPHVPLLRLVIFLCSSLRRGRLRAGCSSEMRRRGFNMRTALVVGDGELGRAVVERLDARPEHGIQAVGVLARDPALVGVEVGSVKVIGLYTELEAILSQQRVDQVYIALAARPARGDPRAAGGALDHHGRREGRPGSLPVHDPARRRGRDRRHAHRRAPAWAGARLGRRGASAYSTWSSGRSSCCWPRPSSW